MQWVPIQHAHALQISTRSPRSLEPKLTLNSLPIHFSCVCGMCTGISAAWSKPDWSVFQEKKSALMEIAIYKRHESQNTLALHFWFNHSWILLSTWVLGSWLQTYRLSGNIYIYVLCTSINSCLEAQVYNKILKKVAEPHYMHMGGIYIAMEISKLTYIPPVHQPAYPTSFYIWRSHAAADTYWNSHIAGIDYF